MVEFGNTTSAKKKVTISIERFDVPDVSTNVIYCAKNQFELLISKILLIDVPLFQKEKKVSCRGW